MNVNPCMFYIPERCHYEFIWVETVILSQDEAEFFYMGRHLRDSYPGESDFIDVSHKDICDYLVDRLKDVFPAAGFLCWKGGAK